MCVYIQIHPFYIHMYVYNNQEKGGYHFESEGHRRGSNGVAGRGFREEREREK